MTPRQKGSRRVNNAEKNKKQNRRRGKPEPKRPSPHWRTVDYIIGIGIAVSLTVSATCYQMDKERGFIVSVWFLVVLIVTGWAVLRWQSLADSRPPTTEHKTPTVEQIAIANQQRGYLQIAPFWIANGDDRVVVRYRYKVDGLTAVTTEGGFMRMSIDEPSPEHTRTNPERFEKPLATVVIDPRTTDVDYDIMFPPLTAEQRTAWSNGELVIFLTGEILYKDSFFPLTLRHRKYFGWRWNGGRVGPNGESFTLNGVVRNDEEDER